MSTTAVSNAQIEITHDDLHAAYMASRLRFEKISLLKALETPVIYKALRNTAIAIKKKKLAADASSEKLPIRAYSTLSPDSAEEAFANIELMLDYMEERSLSNPAFIIETNLAYLRGYLGENK